MVEEKIGIIDHYFTNINVAAIKITAGQLKVGDTIRFVGSTTDFTQKIDHMEINRQSISVANPGDAIGIKVINRVRENDLVYKI
ncbi:MAG: translation elongation factor-like protein [Candidatus Thermoplasmatota archaeon]|nr:translation elongation factor-like protein [Candidatus Thermoplasmatota archaeon]MBU1941824.1 translation elongation factor-like protein [Candidatus Thermoplasmatota archaeon]